MDARETCLAAAARSTCLDKRRYARCTTYMKKAILSKVRVACKVGYPVSGGTVYKWYMCGRENTLPTSVLHGSFFVGTVAKR